MRRPVSRPSGGSPPFFFFALGCADVMACAPACKGGGKFGALRASHCLLASLKVEACVPCGLARRLRDFPMKTISRVRPGTLEILEARIAPAATLTFADVDGDNVTITLSKGSSADLSSAAVRVAEGGGFRLDTLALTEFPGFAGADVTVSAEIAGGGDGFVRLNFFSALGLDLGKVTIDGDLHRIFAGDGKTGNGSVKSLTVRSLGFSELPGPAGSTLDGKVGSLVIAGDLREQLSVTHGGIGSIEIGGSVLGSERSESGELTVAGSVGELHVGGNLTGGGFFAGHISIDGAIGRATIDGDLRGGAGFGSGSLSAGGNIGKITVTGSLIGGTEPNRSGNSGQIHAGGRIDSLTIGGGLVGGTGFNSGAVLADGALASVNIEGGIRGGSGFESGSVRSAAGISRATITGAMEGGAGERSGSLLATGNIASATLEGSLIGGGGMNSGDIASLAGIQKVVINGGIKGGTGELSGAIGSDNAMGSIVVRDNIEGGDGERSGVLVSKAAIRSATVGGDIVGGVGFESGAIGATATVGEVEVKGSIKGGDGQRSGAILSDRSISRVEIKGDVQGGAGLQSGGIAAVGGSIGTVEIGGSLLGGTGNFSGLLLADTIKVAAIHGSVQGNSGTASATISAVKSAGSIFVDGDLTGGTGVYSAGIIGQGNLGTVRIGGSVAGGGGFGSGVIGQAIVSVGANSDGSDAGGAASPGKVGSIEIAGSLTGGTGNLSGRIAPVGSIGMIEITGSIVGGAGVRSGSIETQAPEDAGSIGAVKVAGDVRGGRGDSSGRIFSSGKLGKVEIGTASDTKPGGIRPEVLEKPPIGSLLGGSGLGSGSIGSTLDMGTVQIVLDVIGGGSEAGKIASGGGIARLEIGGSLRGGSPAGQGGSFDTTIQTTRQLGQIYAAGRIGPVEIGDPVEIYLADELPVEIGADILGGSGGYSAQIRGASIGAVTIGGGIFGGPGFWSGALVAEETDIRSVTIRTSLTSGSSAFSGSIHAQRNLGAIEAGSISGNRGVAVTIFAGGKLLPTSDAQAVAIKSLRVQNSTAFADVLAGYDIAGVRANRDAQIGAVSSGVDGVEPIWVGVNLVAGIDAGDDETFGTGDDFPIPAAENGISKVISKIASITIGGTFNFADARSGYGFVAEQVGSLRLSDGPVKLEKGPHNDSFLITTGEGSTDTRLREVDPNPPAA